MRNILIIFFLSLFYISSLFSQEKIDSIKIKINGGNALQNFNAKFEEFEFYRDMNYLKQNFPLNEDPNTIQLWTSAILSKSKSIEEINTVSPHMLAPYHQRYIEDSKFSIIHSVLGAAQLGAVGYLAYKHIKKYGFLK